MDMQASRKWVAAATVLLLALGWRAWNAPMSALPVGSAHDSAPVIESTEVQALRARMQQQREQVEEHQALLLRSLQDAHRHERQLLTPECRFWWLQNDEHPSERTRQKKQQYCET